MANKQSPGELILAELNLSDCAIGAAADHIDGWENLLAPHVYWRMPNRLRVAEEGGEKVLEFFRESKGEFVDRMNSCLVTGDTAWRDYAVEASVRPMTDLACPTYDEPYVTAARNGLVFRQQDVRRCYLLCIEGFNKLILYRREDDVYYPLAFKAAIFDSRRYYSLRVEAVGQKLKCFLDGKPVFDARDGVFVSGPAGIRANAPARFKHLRISIPDKARASFVSRMKRRDRELESLRAEYPQPVLWRRIVPAVSGEFTCRFGNIRGPDRKDVILFLAGRDQATGRMHKLRGIAAADLDGNLLWIREDIVGTASNKGQIVDDLNGDGADEILCVHGDGIVVLDGRTGATVAEAPSPCVDGKQVQISNACLCNLSGNSKARDVVAWYDGEHLAVWAFDAQLKALWKYKAGKFQDSYCPAHNICFHDINGDGRDEVVGGYWILDAGGGLLRQAEFIDDMREHPDACIMDVFDKNPRSGPKLAIAGGGEGFCLFDARDGRLLARHMMGHAQGLSVGNFRPDSPGLDILCATRWDNYGIQCLFSSSGELLCRFQPDNVSQGGPSVNWKGDGSELIFLDSSRQAFGMYDGYGHKVVVFPEGEDGPAGCYYSWWEGQALVADVTGDARDEIVIARKGVIYIYTQDKPYPKGRRIYAPIRKMGQGSVNPISTPSWKINES